MEFRFFDADNHYYEAQDAFTRYASDDMRKRKFVRWLTEADGKRKRLFFGEREAAVIGNPTFDPVVKPGVFHTALKAFEGGAAAGSAAIPAQAAFGELVPIDPAYRDRSVRLATMDAQNVDKVWLFPTLAVTLEGVINDDVEMFYDSLHAFNRWLDDDWGFAHADRIYGVPYLSLLDLDRAVAELDWVLSRGARVITIRPGPAYGRSPADPYFDPFWARVNEAGVVVAYHALEGPSTYTESFRRNWAAPPLPMGGEQRTLERVIAGIDRAISDTLTALILHNLFGRFPNINVASIELGASWVPFLLHQLDHAGGLVSRKIFAFGTTLDQKPSEVFRQRVWISPFPEEDLDALITEIGAGQVLFGSDWPHAEGVVQPADYLPALKNWDDATVRRIMRDNALELTTA